MTIPETFGTITEIWTIWCVIPPKPGSIVQAKYAGGNDSFLAEVCPKGCCVYHLALEETRALPDLWREIPEEEGK